MAGVLIEVDTNLLAKDIGQATEKLSAMRAALKAVYGEMQELDALWDGAANAAFNKQFALDKQSFEEILTQLEALLDDFEFAKIKYDECERQVNSAVAAIRI